MINIVEFFKPTYLKSIEKYVLDFIMHLCYEDSFSIKVSKNVNCEDLIRIIKDSYNECHKQVFIYTWPTYIFKDLGHRVKDKDYYLNVSHELWDSGIFVVNVNAAESNLFKKVIEVKRYNNGWT